MTSLATLTARHVRYRSKHTAVVFEDARLDFAAFDARVNRRAREYRAVCERGGDGQGEPPRPPVAPDAPVGPEAEPPARPVFGFLPPLSWAR